MQDLNLGVVSEDSLENLGVGGSAMNKDEDGSEQKANVGVQTEDYLDKVGTEAGVSQKDDEGARTNAGIYFSFE